MKRRLLIVSLLVLLLALLLSACAAEQEITVNDRGVITTLHTRLPKRVGELLYEAELELRDGDEVSPSLDTLIREPQEIVIRRQTLVQLCVDGATKTVLRRGGTVGELLESEGVALGGDRLVNHPTDRYLRDGMEIYVSDSFSVNVQHDGTSEFFLLHARTVGEALVECGLTLSETDRVTPAPDALLSQGMTITVSRVTTEVLEQEEPLGFETRYERDESLGYDEERVSIPGQNGLARVSYAVTYVDGVEESRTAIRTEVLVEPVTQLILTGPKDPSVVSIVSKKAFYDCDGSGHGYYEITYSDGSVEYERF
ncbi:MAG: DUF348 domain-containing protein [Oscillospiraceae bacterium]|nr:DUF348 domain-containing protein [Oscillospiraceae bacterium]